MDDTLGYSLSKPIFLKVKIWEDNGHIVNYVNIPACGRSRSGR